MADASTLPEEIIHQILNYCSMKEEAFASMICKSWYNAYSSRPLLKFDEYELAKEDTDSHLVFYKFVSNTFHKYEANSTPIHEVRFVMLDRPNISSYIHEWFEGIIRCSAQTLSFDCISDSCITLPQSIYEAKSLKELYLYRCTLLHPTKENMPIFQQLENLKIFHVTFADDRVLENFLSCCSLIQDLKINWCSPIQNIALGQNLPNLKKVSICTNHKDVPIDLQVTHSIVDLSLSGFTLSKSFLHNFGKRFPQLVNLSLERCSSLQKRLCFSSQTVKSLCLGDINGADEVDLDLPGLLSLTHRWDDIGNIPSLLLTTTQEKLSYKTTIRCKQNVVMELDIDCHTMVIDSSWFIRLREFIKVSLPITSVSLNFLFFDTFVEKVRDFVPAPLLEIDQLKLSVGNDVSVAHSILLIDGILWCFRPKAILFLAFGGQESELQQMWESLIERKCEGPCGCSHHIYDVEVMACNMRGGNLQKASVAAIKRRGTCISVCFVLKWKQNDSFSSCVDVSDLVSLCTL